MQNACWYPPLTYKLYVKTRTKCMLVPPPWLTNYMVGTSPGLHIDAQTRAKCMLVPPLAYIFDVNRRAKCMLVPPIDLQIMRKNTCKMYVGTPLGPINLQIMCQTTCRIHVGTPPSPPAYKLDCKTRAEFMLVPPGLTYST